MMFLAFVLATTVLGMESPLTREGESLQGDLYKNVPEPGEQYLGDHHLDTVSKQLAQASVSSLPRRRTPVHPHGSSPQRQTPAARDPARRVHVTQAQPGRLSVSATAQRSQLGSPASSRPLPRRRRSSVSKARSSEGSPSAVSSKTKSSWTPAGPKGEGVVTRSAQHVTKGQTPKPADRKIIKKLAVYGIFAWDLKQSEADELLNKILELRTKLQLTTDRNKSDAHYIYVPRYKKEYVPISWNSNGSVQFGITKTQTSTLDIKSDGIERAWTKDEKAVKKDDFIKKVAGFNKKRPFQKRLLIMFVPPKQEPEPGKVYRNEMGLDRDIQIKAVDDLSKPTRRRRLLKPHHRRLVTMERLLDEIEASMK